MTKTKNNLKYIKGGPGEESYYMTDITLNYTRIRRRAGRTKAEAKEYLAKLRLAAKDGTIDQLLGKEKKKGDTFGEYAESLLESPDWKQKRSHERDRRLLKNLNRTFKDKKLNEIGTGLVRNYMTGRQKDGLAPATINREISLLKSILYQAEYENMIPSNPIRGRRIKRLDENNSREKIFKDLKLSDNDIRRLVDCAAPHFKPILTIALLTGMRRTEILKMKWKDINFKMGTIHIPKENAKSKKERFIPIDSVLFNILDSIEKKGEHVFINDWTGKRRKDVRTAFKEACDRAKIPCGRNKGLTFHDCRHIAAYKLVKMTDIVTASKILGHSDVKMTMRYVHPTEKDKREAIEKMSENLFQGRQYPVNGENTAALNGAEKPSQVQ
jgi:integrase